MKRLAIAVAACLAAAPLASRPLEAQDTPPRAALEERVHRRFTEVVRARVGLNDAQMRRLGEVNQRYEPRRRELVGEERRVRIALREQVRRGDGAEQGKVSSLIEQALRIQRDRLELVEREQRDLAAFMSPVERARYLAVQEQVRRMLEEMRERRAAGRGRLPPL